MREYYEEVVRRLSVFSLFHVLWHKRIPMIPSPLPTTAPGSSEIRKRKDLIHLPYVQGQGIPSGHGSVKGWAMGFIHACGESFTSTHCIVQQTSKPPVRGQIQKPFLQGEPVPAPLSACPSKIS